MENVKNTYYKTTKEFIFKQLTNPNIDKELASKYMNILNWISNKENAQKLKEEQLIEIGQRLHKKFQSSLETK
jgi:hypothetical protein